MRKFAILACLTLASLFTLSEVKANDIQAEKWVDAYQNTFIYAKSAGAAAVNYLLMQNAVTATNPTLSAIGSDTNISLNLQPKGTGVIKLLDGNGNVAFQTGAAVTSAVNTITLTNAATGNNPSVAATGSDTNIGIIVKGQGTGAVVLGQSTATGVNLAADQPICDSAGNEYISFVKTTSAVDQLQVTNAATAGHTVDLAGAGGDTDISISLTPKGAGTINVTGADCLKVNSVIVSTTIPICARFTKTMTLSSTVFIADTTYQVTAIKEVHTTAESTAATYNVNVEKLTGTTAVGSGTALLTDNTNKGINGKGTASTVNTGTLTATTGNLQLTAGDRLGVTFELDNGTVTTGTEYIGEVIIYLKRI